MLIAMFEFVEDFLIGTPGAASYNINARRR
jgi:hypothetical protein